jgi:hypothetical protein
MIRLVLCLECGHEFEIQEEQAGDRCPCPSCQADVCMPGKQVRFTPPPESGITAREPSLAGWQPARNDPLHASITCQRTGAACGEVDLAPLPRRRLGLALPGASGRSTAGVAVCCLLLVLRVGHFINRVFSHASEQSATLTFGPQEEICYGNGITKAEAGKLGRALQDRGYFNGKGGKTVQLSKNRAGLVVSVVVRTDAWNDPAVINDFRLLGQQLSREVFAGQVVEVQLCDPSLSPEKSIK